MSLLKKLDDKFIEVIQKAKPKNKSLDVWMETYSLFLSNRTLYSLDFTVSSVPQLIHIINEILETKEIEEFSKEYIKQNKYYLSSYIQAEANTLKFIVSEMCDKLNITETTKNNKMNFVYNEYITSFNEEIEEFSRLIT